MRSITLRLLLLLLGYTLFLVPVSQAATQQINVTFINPDSRGDPFWDRTTQFMRWFAEDLNIELEVLHARENRFNVASLAEEVMRRDTPPHYLIFIYQHGSGKVILEMAEQLGQHSLIFNTAIHPEEAAEVGAPRERFQHWLGHLQPNDRRAGQILAEHLISAAQARAPQPSAQTLEMIAISGSKESTPALQRNQGLADALALNRRFTVNQLVFARWDPATAASQASALLSRYPQTSMIWAASDAMALKIYDTLQATSRQKSPPVIGGIDWTPEAFKAVQRGTLAVTVGGHFLEGGWALVLAHDHFHGKDFASLDTTMKTGMARVTQANIEEYAAIWDKSRARAVDYRYFSRVLNPEWPGYRFSADALINRIKAGILATEKLKRPQP